MCANKLNLTLDLFKLKYSLDVILFHLYVGSASLSGVLKFARLVKMYETQDPEIAAMSVKLKSLLLPPLSTPPIGGAIPTS